MTTNPRTNQTQNYLSTPPDSSPTTTSITPDRHIHTHTQHPPLPPISHASIISWSCLVLLIGLDQSSNMQIRLSLPSVQRRSQSPIILRSCHTPPVLQKCFTRQYPELTQASDSSTIVSCSQSHEIPAFAIPRKTSFQHLIRFNSSSDSALHPILDSNI